jgi:hypothetical protein
VCTDSPKRRSPVKSAIFFILILQVFCLQGYIHEQVRTRFV